MMTRKRYLTLDDYGISDMRYKELQFFCVQYPEWKKTLMKEKEETVREMLMHKCQLIEACAEEAGDDLSEYLIQSVCCDQPLWYLTDIMRMPVCATNFYAIRRKFFDILNQKKLEEDSRIAAWKQP